MLQPKSKLPFKQGEDEAILSADNNGVVTGHYGEGSSFNWEEDGEYVIQACNNFPEAINLLKIAKEALEELGEFQDGWNEDLDKIEKFLEKIYKDGE